MQNPTINTAVSAVHLYFVHKVHAITPTAAALVQSQAELRGDAVLLPVDVGTHL